MENNPSAGFVRSKLPQNRHEKSTLFALLIFCADLFAYLISFWVIVLAPYWSVKVIAILLNGLFIGSLFIIGHDACHGSFVKQSWLNHLLGRLAFLPSLNTFTAWEVSHNQFHHGFTNFRQNDVYVPLSKSEYDSLSKFGKLIQRFYRNPIGIVFYYKIEFWWKQMIFPRKQNMERMNKKMFLLDLALIIGYLTLKIFVLYFFSPFLADYFQVSTQSFSLSFFLAFVLPFAVWIWWYVYITLLHHTHPQVPWFENKKEWDFFRSQVEAGIHINTSRLASILLNDVFEHTAHHVDIRIPLYKLRKSQNILKLEFPNNIRTHQGFLISAIRTLKICKLYDYQNHCWTDFEGNVTSKIEGVS